MKKRKFDNPSLYKIFSFYNSKVNPEVPRYQKAVFHYLGYSIHQIKNENYKEHGDFLNHICREITDTKYLILFDIDCVPVTKNWLSTLMADLKTPGTLAGAAQTANHLRNAQNLYVSPFFFGISTDYLKKLHYPDLRMTNDMDGGQNLTEQVIKDEGHIVYWWPTHVEEKKWSLYHPEHTYFGPGTTYNHAVYHAFLSLHGISGRFFKKCKEVLPWYYFKWQWKKL